MMKRHLLCVLAAASLVALAHAPVLAQEAEQPFQITVDGQVVAGDTLPAAAPLLPALVPRPVHEDAAHRLGRGREEMPATVPSFPVLTRDEPHIGLVNESGGLERLTGFLGSHPRGGELPQLVVHER